MLRPEGRTAAEVTAAAERTADLALRVVDLHRKLSQARGIAVALEGQVARVRAVAEELGCSRLHTAADAESGQHNVWCNGATWSRATIEERLRAALDPDPADHGTGRDGEGS